MIVELEPKLSRSGFSINNQQSSINTFSMSIVRLKIDVSGTTGDEAWREIKQFDQIQSAGFGPQFGSGGLSTSPAATTSSVVPPSEPRRTPYPKGAWIGAEIKLQTPLLAQYAVSHYLEQERVLDADVVE
jgi:hypothetical protein